MRGASSRRRLTSARCSSEGQGPTTRLVVVGITRGMTQATNAIAAAHAALQQGLPMDQVLAIAKRTASFSGGAIRSNLVSMLDAIGVARHFGIATTAELFRPESADVHFTSALRYPVFVDGKNYKGTPDLLGTPLLRAMIDRFLAEEPRPSADGSLAASRPQGRGRGQVPCPRAASLVRQGVVAHASPQRCKCRTCLGVSGASRVHPEDRSRKPRPGGAVHR